MEKPRKRRRTLAVGEAKPRQRRAEPTEGMPYDFGTAQAVAGMDSGWSEAASRQAKHTVAYPHGEQSIVNKNRHMPSSPVKEHVI